MRIETMALGLGVVACMALACASGNAPKGMAPEANRVDSPEWVEQNTTAKRDDYRQSIALRGPDVEHRIGKQGGYYRAHVRGVMAKNGARRFQIYVAARLKGQWHNLHRAKDQDGIPFPVSKVSRNQQCPEGDCSYYEHISIPIPAEYLPVRTRTDIDLYVEGPGGAIVVTIPATYVQGFLARVDAEDAAMTAANRAPKRDAKVSYCEAKYTRDSRALSFCRKEARASYERLKPSIESARRDAFTRNAKVLDTCMRRHNGDLGIDWMMVEHCYGKALGRSAGGPASR